MSPNPASISFETTVILADQGKMNLALYDAAGRPVRQIPAGQVDKGTYRITSNVSDLANGIYLLRSSINGESGSAQITIKH